MKPKAELLQKKKLSAIKQKTPFILSPLDCNSSYALSTLPDLKQEVQTYCLFVAPFTLHLTDLIFGLNFLLDLLCEWLTLFPKRTPLPQTAHLAILAPPYMKLSLAAMNRLQAYNMLILTEVKMDCKKNLHFFSSKT